jgi:chromosomal replication initiation ATPase DnaA
MNELIDKVVYKIRKDKLKHKSRKREFINKRMYLYYLLKEHDYSYTDIGKLFSCLIRITRPLYTDVDNTEI